VHVCGFQWLSGHITCWCGLYNLHLHGRLMGTQNSMFNIKEHL